MSARTDGYLERLPGVKTCLPSIFSPASTNCLARVKDAGEKQAVLVLPGAGPVTMSPGEQQTGETTHPGPRIESEAGKKRNLSWLAFKTLHVKKSLLLL